MVTDADGRVIRIDLSNKNLSGEIPPTLGQLTSLESLSLYGNRLSGPIPPELGNLRNLREFDVHDNRLTGRIPPALGRLTNLERLNVSNNRLDGPLPRELGDLGNLKYLGVSGNEKLAGELPPELCRLALQRFYFDLTELHAPYSPAFRAWMGRMTVVFGTGWASDLGALIKLYRETGGRNWNESEGWLTDKPLNDWKGVDADADGRVIRIGLPDNNLSGLLLPDLGRLAGLTSLSLYRNKLIGPIPSELGNLGSLVELNLFDNGLTGPIPPQLGRLTNLGRLNLSNNQLEGPLPRELGDLGNLKHLGVSGNGKLAGELPPELCRLELESFYFDFTELHAPYSAAFRAWMVKIAVVSGTGWVSDLGSLTLLYREAGGPSWRHSDNWLTAQPLGEWFGVDTDGDGRVTRLILKGNNLSGFMPPALGNLTQLRELRFYSNRLTGGIPDTLGNLTNLSAMVLSLNRLEGSIPRELGNLRDLRSLALNNNRLTGEIPAELGGLAQLDRLNVGKNELSGAVPGALGDLGALTVLGIHGNAGLSGGLPDSLAQLSLRVFHYHETGVSVPRSLASWLSGIRDRRGPDSDWTRRR